MASEISIALSLPRPWTVTRSLAVIVALLLLASTAGQVLRLHYGYTYGAGLVPSVLTKLSYVTGCRKM